MPVLLQYLISDPFAGRPCVLLALLLYRLSRPADNSGLESRIDSLERMLERQERLLREELTRNREEALLSARQGREENASAVSAFGDSLLKRMSELAGLQKDQLDIFAVQLKGLTASNEGRMDKLRETVEERLRLIQDDTARKLEQMRATVDEKLHDTLEKRLGESFKLVSERLELVQRGLGEMQTLASGVGDLKKVLTNVKTRGTFGEIQLSSLLEQVLSPGQYESNVETRKGSGQRVEFALKLPGRDGTPDGMVWLPLDAKFPQEDYLRLVEAQESADILAAAEAAKQLEKAVRLMAAQYPRQVSGPAPYDRFRRDVPADRGAVCRGPASSGAVRCPAARFQGDGRRSDHPGGHAEQSADGVPDPGHRETLGRGLESAGGRAHGIFQIRPGAGKDQQKTAGGRQSYRCGRRPHPLHREEAEGCAGDARAEAAALLESEPWDQGDEA